ncbi:putative uncharacterized protein [Dorea sp. CAG:105]|nr:putative uncharacterized protein [Dorea sp. CAG:105]
MQDPDQKIKEMHMGRLIHILSHQMKRHNCGTPFDDTEELTAMQRHVLKFILLESEHKDIYRKMWKKNSVSASLQRPEY